MAGGGSGNHLNSAPKVLQSSAMYVQEVHGTHLSLPARLSKTQSYPKDPSDQSPSLSGDLPPDKPASLIKFQIQILPNKDCPSWERWL